MDTHDILDQREADHAIKNYTRVANMLVDGYPELHPQDKWLFVCLCRLCGKEKTRHLSLRFISKRTGFSPSVLSDNKKNNKPGMIRRLHTSGLIHAEIKRKLDSDGEVEKQAQYHITITDTWALNYDFYNNNPKCSEIEQSNNESVLIPNATVLKQNTKDNNCSDSERNCSETERECSDSSTILRLHSNTTNKITSDSKITGNGIVVTAHADDNAPTAFFIHPIHSHLCFDDLMHPTQMQVELIPEKHPHWTELEYKYRTRSAEEIRQELLSKGISVKVTYIEKDPDETVNDQTPASDESFQPPLLADIPITQPKQKGTAANAKEKIATDKPVKPVKAKKQPTVSKEELALRKQVHTWVNERRGYSLQGRATAGAVLQENISCTTLANLLYRGINQNDPEGCTWGDLAREWDYIAKNDKYWKLSENKNRIGAQALLQMFAQTMPKVRQPNISINSTTTPSGTMVHNEACNVAQDAIAKGKQHGYVIDAKVYSSGGGWLVNVVWDGDTLVPIESQAMWNEQFAEIHKFEQELLQQEQKKGAK